MNKNNPYQSVSFSCWIRNVFTFEYVCAIRTFFEAFFFLWWFVEGFGVAFKVFQNFFGKKSGSGRSEGVARFLWCVLLMDVFLLELRMCSGLILEVILRFPGMILFWF